MSGLFLLLLNLVSNLSLRRDVSPDNEAASSLFSDSLSDRKRYISTASDDTTVASLVWPQV